VLSVVDRNVMDMQMRYRYRLEQTPAQQRMFERICRCCRVVFNDSLRVRDEAFRAGVRLTDSEIQRRVITLAKTTAKRAWLSQVPSVALVQAVNDSLELHELPPQVRQWTCPGCGAVRDRDLNAAKVILAAGRAERLNASHLGGRNRDSGSGGATVRPPFYGEARGYEAGSVSSVA
jgi:Helix-turn-helix domain